MTFKHVKFEDSAVMRSLEKVASEKGWAKSDPLKKTASSKTDLFPTINLTENILKLCEGLRQQGFNKYADELEDKFVVYKQAAAATLYETTSEEGKDLVDAAHPKGSHHLEGLDSDEAVIETILDQHLKDTKMVEKTPTGKLSSLDILKKVRVVLAQNPPPAKKAGEEAFTSAVDQMIQLCETVRAAEDTSEISYPRHIFSGGYYTSQLMIASIGRHLDAMIDYLKEDRSKPATVTLIDDRMKGYFEPFNHLISTATNISGDRKKMYLSRAAAISQKFSDVKKMLQQSADEGLGEKKPEPAAPPPSEAQNAVTKFNDQVKSIARTLSIWLGKTQTDPDNDDADKKKASDWISGKVAALNKLKSMFDGLPDDEAKQQSVPSFTANLNAITKDFESFRTAWIG